MSVLDRFRQVVESHTGGNAKKALPLGDYLTMMGITLPARRSSARAQITRDLKVSGKLRDLVQKGLIYADTANRQPECFEGVEQKASTLPVVITEGPIADLRTFLVDNLTPEARDGQKALTTILSTARLPVRAAETIARHTSKLLFEVEREKLRADAAEERSKLQEKHLEQVKEMYHLLVRALPSAETTKEAAE